MNKDYSTIRLIDGYLLELTVCLNSSLSKQQQSKNQ